jgi:hypothetical protein
MSSFHWLIVVPYYFFLALLTFLILSVACRLVRASVGANSLAIVSIVVGLALTAFPLISGWISLESYTGMPLLALGVTGFVVAAIDSVLKSSHSLPLDEELEDV